MPEKPIYLDYNATTPIDPRVGQEMLPYINEHFGNPSSSHFYGAQTRLAVEEARRRVAGLLGCPVEEIIFTSGGSESNNYAIKGAALANHQKGNHIITSAIEHPAVTEVCRYLESQGFKVTYLPVDEFGQVDPADLRKAITPQTILITIMHANNEVGTIQPIAELSAIARESGILMHTDCAQSIGKIPVKVDELGVDLLSLAGHKLYAPKGIGALYVRSGVKLEKLIHGADHERNWRAGTENVIEIVGLGKACQLADEEISRDSTGLAHLRDRLEKTLRASFPECRVNGHPRHRLPNTSSISFPGLEANTIVSALSDRVAVSAGAACHSDQVDLSATLRAMKTPSEYAMGTIRFSVGRFSSEEEIDRAVAEIQKVLKSMTPTGGMWQAEQTEEIKLTRYTHGLGCACKLRPQLLEEALKKLPVPKDNNILVGADTFDDAAVYRIDDQTAIIQTVDFFTPIVDDPFQFGAIAAANSLSDIYAMGGRPLFALNVVGFPSNRLPVTVLEQILAGAQSVAEQAGIAIIGGHTVDDTEPKFGLAVTGMAHPDRIVRNTGAQAGDALILTKPLGTGILSTALKEGKLTKKQESALIDTMLALNDHAARIMLEYEVHACTDVTGFGLIGHLSEMLRDDSISVELFYDQIPFLPAVYDLAVGGIIPGGSRDNAAYTSGWTSYQGGISEIKQFMLNDAQTSGGLLMAVPEQSSVALVDQLQKNNVPAVKIGGIVPCGEDLIYVRQGV